MSEMINNREQHIPQNMERLSLLRTIFMDLYNGKNVDEVKAHFDHKIGKITVEEVAQLSQLQREILEARDLPEEEVHRLSSAHMAIIKGNIVSNPAAEDVPGHPIHTFKLENMEIGKLIRTQLVPHLRQFAADDSVTHAHELAEDCTLLYELDKHYHRKEHLIFPYLEKCGIKGPSINMWRMDDFIRDYIKDAKQKLLQYDGDKQAVIHALEHIIEQVSGMIYREENILFPMALDHLTEDEWIKIARESDKIGFCLTEPAAIWQPERADLEEQSIAEGFVNFETGVLSVRQLELILNHLPIDMTFIDHNDVVRYFSQGKEKIFHRTKTVIGRTVQNCHPPKSMHIVEKILDDFKSGQKDVEDFWIKMRDKFVYIRYFAVRDEHQNYIGTLEFTQNIEPIQAIEGEKRILS